MTHRDETQSAEQRLAKFAWEKLDQVEKKSDLRAYVVLAKGAPALVMGNGLMQALAFYSNKSDKQSDPKTLLRDHLLEWLKDRGCIDDTEYGKAMTSLYRGSSCDYMRATEESLAILRWLRQLGDARKR